MSFQDVITYSQPVVKILENMDSVKILQEIKYSPIISAIKKTPKTVQDIYQHLKEDEKTKTKSIQTIYRYLNVLENAGLVSKAGKRVFVEADNQLRTQTLYITSAKIILSGIKQIFQEKGKGRAEFDENYTKLMSTLYGSTLNTNLSYAQFKDFLIQIYARLEENLVRIFKNANPSDLNELIEKYPGEYLNSLVRTIAWLTVLLEEKELVKDFERSFSN